MNGSGLPQVVSATIKLGDINASDKVLFTTLSDDEEVIGKDNFHSYEPKNVKVKKTSFDISRNLVSDTELCFSITVKCSKVTGTLQISDIKLKGHRIYLEDGDFKKKIPKKDLIDLMSYTESSSADNYVQVGSNTISINRDLKTFQGSFVSSSGSTSVDLKGEGKFSGDIKVTIPDQAGNNLDNILYTIDNIEINYSFIPKQGAQSTGNYKKDFKKRIAFYHFNKNNIVTLPINKDYFNHYATAFYVTKDKFRFDTFKYITDKRPPIIVRAFLSVMMHYGIETFSYDMRNLLAASRVDSDGAYFHLIDFRYKFNKLVIVPNSIKVDSLKHVDTKKSTSGQAEPGTKEGNLREITKEKISVSDNKFSVKMEDIKNTYAFKFNLSINQEPFTNMYFFVEVKKIDITVLGANTIARTNLQYEAIRNGSSHSFITAYQVLEQIEGGLSSAMAEQSIKDLLTYLPFAIFGLGLFFEYAIWMSMMDIVWALVYAELNWQASEGIVFFNEENLNYSSANEDNVKSFIGRGTNLKANLNTDNNFKGTHNKTSVFTNNNSYFAIGMFIGEYILLTDEMNIPSYPYTATFNIKDNSDIFDSSGNIVLTSELKNWVRLTLNAMFSINYGLPKIFNAIDQPNNKIHKKPIHKRITFVKAINNIPINPMIDYGNNKLVADLKVEDFISGNKDKIIKDLKKYIKKIGKNGLDTKNKLLLFICNQLLKVIEGTTPSHIKRVIIATQDGIKVDNEKIKLLFNSDLFSPPIIYDSSKNTIYKTRTRQVLPSKVGKSITNEKVTDSDIYYYADENIKFCATLKDYMNNTAPIPDFSPSLFI